jgi:hypothetical protein
LPQSFLGFFSKFPCKSINSLLALILEIWKENFKKKILEKGNPNLHVDVIILTQENRGHPLLRNPEDLAQGII